MTRVYVDTNIFLYAIGEQSPYRTACRDLVRALGSDALIGETSVETIQELVHHRRRRGDPTATERGRGAADLCSTVHALDQKIVLAALELIDRHPSLPTRDAVHAATALARSIRLILSADRDFDAVTGVERIDPLNREAIEGLMRRGSAQDAP